MTTLTLHSDIAITLTAKADEPRVDTRLLAQHLGNTHKSVMALVERYKERFLSFGQLPFKKEVGDRVQGGGNAARFALLNEDQAFCLVALSRNTDRVVGLKVKLVQAFSSARKAAELRRTEYLPSYHLAHDALRGLAPDPEHQRLLHLNVNRLANKVAGIEAGQRAQAQRGSLSVLAVAQMLAARAVVGAVDDKAAYAAIKAAVQPLQALALAQQLEVAR